MAVPQTIVSWDGQHTAQREQPRRSVMGLG